MLKPAHRTVRLRSEDSVHLEPFTRFTGAELELFLDTANGVTAIAFFRLKY